MLYPKQNKVLKQLNGETGEIEVSLVGGERIFSIPHTKEIVIGALKSKTSNDYKNLGSRIIQILDQQDKNKPEYV